MPKLPGVSHRRAVRAFRKAGFAVVREGKHIAMFNGEKSIILPRHDPIKAVTMAVIIQQAGLTVEEFKALL